MKKAFIFFLVFVSPVFAVKEYYSLTRSLRALGMGGAFYGLSNDEYAMFYNPAGVSLYEGRPQLMLNSTAQLGSRTLPAYKKKNEIAGSFPDSIDALARFQGDPLYLGASVLPYFLMKNLAAGILVGDLKTNYLLSGKELDSAVDLTAILDSGIFVTYGRSVLNENVHVGLTTKGIARAGGRTSFTLGDLFLGNKLNLNPQDLGGAGFGIDFDLGIIYDIPYLSFGEANQISLVINNVLASRLSMGSQAGKMPPGLVRSVSLGWYSVFSGWGVFDHIHFLADFAEFSLGGQSDPELGAPGGKFLKHLNMGLEFPIGILKLRGGLHQGYWTAGLGLNLKYCKLEFATYGEELSSGPGRLESRRYGLTVALGMGQLNQPFKPSIKGKRVEKVDKDLEIKLKPKQEKPAEVPTDDDDDSMDDDSSEKVMQNKKPKQDLEGQKKTQQENGSLNPLNNNKRKEDSSLYQLENLKH